MITDIDIKIWGRDFNLPIAYDWFEDEEELLPSQKNTVKYITENNQLIDAVLSNVKKYVLQFISAECEVDNVFKYVIPRKIYVLRDEKSSFALFCDFKFDLEHGIAIVFENNNFLKIVSQDYVL